MVSLRIVRVPLLERVVLEELAERWKISPDETLAKLIREAARREVMNPRGMVDTKEESRGE